MAQLTFLGTRGEIEARTDRHRMHTSLMIEAEGKRIMIDCGLDWLGKVYELKPDALLLTHAHKDHAWGLREGAPCPVYAPERTWKTLENCWIQKPVTIPLKSSFESLGTRFIAFPVDHSINCPAVGYKIKLGART